MDAPNVIKVGIGFATGRKSFRKVLKTYIYNWLESGLVKDRLVQLNLFVAYDLNYQKSKATDFTRIKADLLKLVDQVHFIGEQEIAATIADLTDRRILTARDIEQVFGRGYAAMRNIVLYQAMKHGMDYLIFLDDDEYPLAVTKTRATAIWSGQHILSCHLKAIGEADITYGHHCGYISPIPSVTFNDILDEATFRTFIEAISNDIVNWETIRKVMANGGVTYADTSVLTSEVPEEVEEVNHAKFISGSNLCINLTRPERVFPFYNPPNARGEDTFLSTCLQDRKVLRIPCYAFHDGFATYNHLLDGVLPTHLHRIEADSEAIINRFLKACIGWIRYKPLLVMITSPDQYDEKIARMRLGLEQTLPVVCEFFGNPDFMKIKKELDTYHRKVKSHAQAFDDIKRFWSKITQDLQDQKPAH
ncbi:MAG: hypothetical protein EOM08_08505 [Clostridia bacterium]|nr:hypothetical protein [Clostridia bacterium]NCC76458.1 hypothetical protein [Clostridia bacterium]